MAPQGRDPASDFSATDYRPLAEINVTPMVDVMLVLLIIFMVAAPLMMAGVPVQLPKTSAEKIAPPREPLVVSMDKDGAFFVRKEPVATAEALVAKLSALRAEAPDQVVYVRADRGLEYGRVMSLMGLVGQAGFAKVSLVAEGVPPGAPAGGR
ncbi:MAG TPA: ExbD/TolR family protein [Alphaproteobacteria bacterium]